MKPTTDDSADASAKPSTGKAARFDPDEFLARKYNGVTVDMIVPHERRASDPSKYTLTFRTAVKKVVDAVGGVPQATYAIKTACEERKQTKKRTPRKALLIDLQLILKSPRLFMRQVNNTSAAAAVEDHVGDVVADASADASTRHGTVASTNTSTAVSALESDTGTSPQSAPALLDGVSNEGTTVANTTSAVSVHESAPKANSSRKRSKLPQSQQSKGPAQPANTASRSDVSANWNEIYFSVLDEVVSDEIGKISTTAQQTMGGAVAFAFWRYP